MVSRRSRSNSSQYTPGTGVGNGGGRGVNEPDRNRSPYEGRGSSHAYSPRSNAHSARMVPSRGASPSRGAAASGTTPNTVKSSAPARTTALSRSVSDAAQYSRSSGNYGNNALGNNGQRKSVKRRSAKEPRKRLNISKGTKISIIVLGVLLAILIGGGIAFYKFVSSVNSELAGGKSEEEMLAIQDSLVAREDFDAPFYVLLLGSDERADDTSMGSRADTCIVVRVDCASNQATMISIPRDTKIVYKGSTMKFNAAYAYDGAAGSIRAASDLLDIDISHYAEVNFDTLIQLVDTVGGVEVDVPQRINDPDAGSIVIEAGPQTLNGEAALVFARSRAYADGDFARSSNQRLLIEALVTKVLSLPVDQIPGVVQSAAKCVTTDMSASDIFSMAMEFVDDDGDITIYSTMVPSSLTMINGISYVVADQVGLNKVMEAIEAGEDPSTVETSGITSSSLDKKREESE